MIGWYLAIGLACSLAVFFFYLWVSSQEELDAKGEAMAHLRNKANQLAADLNGTHVGIHEMHELLADARIERDALRDELAKLKAPKVRAELGAVDQVSEALKVAAEKLNQPKKRVGKAKVPA